MRSRVGSPVTRVGFRKHGWSVFYCTAEDPYHKSAAGLAYTKMLLHALGEQKRRRHGSFMGTLVKAKICDSYVQPHAHPQYGPHNTTILARHVASYIHDSSLQRPVHPQYGPTVRGDQQHVAACCIHVPTTPVLLSSALRAGAEGLPLAVTSTDLKSTCCSILY